MRPNTLDLYLTHNAPAELADIARRMLAAGKSIRTLLHGLESGIQVGERVMENKQALEKLARDATKVCRTHLEHVDNVWGMLFDGEESVQNVSSDGEFLLSVTSVDGLSVVDSGYAVGTLVGIYKQQPKETLYSARTLVGSMYIVYGTSMYVGMSFGAGLHIFKEHEDGVFRCERAFVQVHGDSHIAALGGFDTMAYVDGYKDLALKLSRDQFTLRYSGSLVADIHLLFMKGGGLFIHLSRKLRTITECAPIAYLLQQAGGHATNGVRSMMQADTTNPQETTIFLGGSKDIVEMAMSTL